eukprot:2687037-Lingulodinium_polyedra.AAC.1
MAATVPGLPAERGETRLDRLRLGGRLLAARPAGSPRARRPAAGAPRGARPRHGAGLNAGCGSPA